VTGYAHFIDNFPETLVRNLVTDLNPVEFCALRRPGGIGKVALDADGNDSGLLDPPDSKQSAQRWYELSSSIGTPNQAISGFEVAAESAALEEVVQATLMYILQLDATAAHAQFGNLGLTRKVLNLKELGLNMLQDTMAKDDFNALLRLIELRVGSRNTVIHGSWTPDEKVVKFEHAMDMTYGTRPPEGVVATNPKFGIATLLNS
jgi:hypothetical protein